MRHSPQPSLPSPSFPLSRAGFVRPGEVRAEDGDGVAAWLAHLDAGRIAVHVAGDGAGRAGGTLGAASADAGFRRAA